LIELPALSPFFSSYSHCWGSWQDQIWLLCQSVSAVSSTHMVVWSLWISWVLGGRDNYQPKLRDSVWGIRATQLDEFDSLRARRRHYPSPFIHPQVKVDGDSPVQIAPGPHMQTSDRLSFFQLGCAGKRPCRRGRRGLSSQSGRDPVNSSSGFRTGTDVWMRSSLLLDQTPFSTRETRARVSDHIDSHYFRSEPPSRGGRSSITRRGV